MRRLPVCVVAVAAFVVTGAPAFGMSEPAADPNAEGTNSADMLSALGTVFEQTPGWAWLALFAGILGGLIAGKIVQTIFRRVGERLHAQGRDARGIVFDSLAGSAYLMLMTLGIQFGLGGVRMTAEVGALAQSVLVFLYTLAVGWFVFRMVDLVDVVLARHIEKSQSKLAAQIAPLLRKAFRIFVIIIFTLFIAQNVFGVNITAWLAGLGIAGLAISLASQDSVKNLFGSVTVMLDKPFAVGDRIQFSGVDGFVEEIGFRSTRIRTFTGHLVTVPNMRFIDSTVENISVSYWYFLDAVKGHDWWGYLDHAQAINHRLFEAFGAADIEFAFPTQTLYLAGDPSRELAVRVLPGTEGTVN